MPQSPPINTVVVGFGVAGRLFHCYLIGLVPELNLYGVVSRRPEAGPGIEELGARRFARLEEALADERVDLVVTGDPERPARPAGARRAGRRQACRHRQADGPQCRGGAKHGRRGPPPRPAPDLLSEPALGPGLPHRAESARRGSGRRAGLARNLLERPEETPAPGAARRSAGAGAGSTSAPTSSTRSCSWSPPPVVRVYAQFGSGVHDNDVEDHACCLLTFANGVLAQVTTSSVARVAETALVPRRYPPAP